MSEKKKATLRIGKGKPGHNDRSETENNRFIDQSKITSDKFYTINQLKNDVIFEDVKPKNNVFSNFELEKYTEYFGEALKIQNEKHLKRRQKNRIKNMEDILNSEKTEPDEIVLQIGDKEKHANEKELEDCTKEFIKRINLLFGENIKLLDVGFHFDETTPHAHCRYTLCYHDKDNNLQIGTTKALRELGIKRPDKTKKADRYNNEKITFTDIMRKHWYMIIKEHGIEIDEVVKNPSQRHLSLLEYKTQQEQEKLSEYQKENFNIQKYYEQAKIQYESDKKTIDANKQKAIEEYNEKANREYIKAKMQIDKETKEKLKGLGLSGYDEIKVEEIR